ncbi:MAG: VOC family protein [Clostridia bacterium]
MNFFNRPLDHVNIKVKNIDEALEFYTKTLGFKLVGHFQSVNELFFVSDGFVTYELVQNSDASDSSFTHVAYTSTDIEADFAYFKNLGLTVKDEISHSPKIFENGAKLFFIKGPGGESIEFMQRL